MPVSELREQGYRVIDWIADYLARIDELPVLARVAPGQIAGSLPGVTLSNDGPTVYQVSRRSFLFFRNPRPDAVDPATGERYTDVIVFWVDSEDEKEAIKAQRQARREQRLKEFDKDGDGTLSESEREAAREALRGHRRRF